MWPKTIRARLESVTFLIVMSVFSSYLAAFTLGVTRFAA